MNTYLVHFRLTVDPALKGTITVSALTGFDAETRVRAALAPSVYAITAEHAETLSGDENRVRKNKCQD